jgi:hypothetical protein
MEFVKIRIPFWCLRLYKTVKRKVYTVIHCLKQLKSDKWYQFTCNFLSRGAKKLSIGLHLTNGWNFTHMPLYVYMQYVPYYTESQSRRP